MLRKNILAAIFLCVMSLFMMPMHAKAEDLTQQTTKEELVSSQDGSVLYYKDGIFQEDYNGFLLMGENWFLLQNGRVMSETSGFYEYDEGVFYVALGRLAKEANGLVQDPYTGKWQFVAQGQVQKQYSGMAEYDGAWFYVKKGKLQEVTGFYAHDGAKFYLLNGRIVLEANGLVLNPADNQWYFVAQGQLQNTSGLVEYQGQWFFIKAGKLMEVTGLNSVNGREELFYMDKGRICFELNGFYPNLSKPGSTEPYMYVENGMAKSGRSMAQYGDILYSLWNGVIRKDDQGWIVINWYWYFVEDGVVCTTDRDTDAMGRAYEWQEKQAADILDRYIEYWRKELCPKGVHIWDDTECTICKQARKAGDGSQNEQYNEYYETYHNLEQDWKKKYHLAYDYDWFRPVNLDQKNCQHTWVHVKMEWYDFVYRDKCAYCGIDWLSYDANHPDVRQ